MQQKVDAGLRILKETYGHPEFASSIEAASNGCLRQQLHEIYNILDVFIATPSDSVTSEVGVSHA